MGATTLGRWGLMALATAGCAMTARAGDADGGGSAPADTPVPVDGVSNPPTDGGVPSTPDSGTFSQPIQNNAIDSVDILFVVDNSNSMAANQANLARSFGSFVGVLLAPPDRNMDGLPDAPPARSLHVGVVSSDLGTPGSTLPSCANSDIGDDGLLNPIRNGQAMRSHQPWTTAPAGVRPARCMNSPEQYPSFLTFAGGSTDAGEFHDDFVCNAYLSIAGCGLEQPLESAYRALVVHNPRAQAGNRDPNAGFVRPDAVLAIVVFSDEEDGSVRDCRYAESGVTCTDGIGVFDNTSAAWASTDLNLRFYRYAPGSAQDPTWNLDRYINPRIPTRGFTSLKPNRPENVVFAAIAGIPLDPPVDAAGEADLAALLGNNPDGSDGYTGMSAEGPVSMRQRNMDPSCSTRVVPACRREGSAYDPMRPPCDTAVQYFALPSRRIVEVARRFESAYQNGTVSSICRNDYTDAFGRIAQRIQRRFSGRCLARAVPTAPATCCGAASAFGCSTGPLCADPRAAGVRCEVREVLPPTVNPLEWCTPAHGRRRAPGAGGTVGGQAVCVVDQVAVVPGMAAPAGSHGFFYDTTPDPTNPSCPQRIAFTDGDTTPTGAQASLVCAQ
ncbi:MAG: hypothetical protein Q8S73_03060 [Deltaproteobacteria bacterium]|nr:hypothetical protein [Myxococcales bacterium]MDP3213059.1 hypothetical protein [Deltaproteobacteria bacterium]